jgi:hypothetical protein
MKSKDSEVISSFQFEFYIMFNTNIWSHSGDSHARLTGMSKEAPHMTQLSRLAPNVCHSYQDVTDQVFIICYFNTINIFYN